MMPPELPIAKGEAAKVTTRHKAWAITALADLDGCERPLDPVKIRYLAQRLANWERLVVEQTRREMASGQEDAA